ncbi:hypothetical protein HK405_002642, partial [Cladochytrium tenue]
LGGGGGGGGIGGGTAPGSPIVSAPGSPSLLQQQMLQQQLQLEPLRRLGSTLSLDEVRLLNAAAELGHFEPPPDGRSWSQEDLSTIVAIARRARSTQTFVSSPLADPSVQGLWSAQADQYYSNMQQQQQPLLGGRSSIPILVTEPPGSLANSGLPDDASLRAAAENAMIAGDLLMGFGGNGGGPKPMLRSRSLDVRDDAAVADPQSSAAGALMPRTSPLAPPLPLRHATSGSVTPRSWTLLRPGSLSELDHAGTPSFGAPLAHSASTASSSSASSSTASSPSLRPKPA